MSTIPLSRNRRHRRLAGGALATAALAAVAIASTGASAADEPVITDPAADQMATMLGTPDDSTKAPEQPDLGTILPSAEFKEASFKAAGVGLRNQAQGGITINGVDGVPIKTFVYWADITDGDNASRQSVRVTRLSPGGGTLGQTVAGTAIGTGPSPCWGGDRLTVYRGTVYPVVARGNGTYSIRATGGSSTWGESPWPSRLRPRYLEGASLVMIYRASGSSVSVFDKAVGGARGLSGNMFYGTSNYALQRNIPSQGKPGLFAEIGADGQTGFGHNAFAAGEVTRLNGVDTAGGKSGKGSDWDGDDGNPLPQLWDTHVHDVGGILDSTRDTVEVEAGHDCLTHIANVIAG